MKHYTETEIRSCFDNDKLQLSSDREIKSFSPVITSVSPTVDQKKGSEGSETNSSSTTKVLEFTTTTTTTTTTTSTTTTLTTTTTKSSVTLLAAETEDADKIGKRKEEISSGVITVTTSSTDIERKHDDFTPASTTVGDDNKIEKETTVTSDETEKVLQYSIESFSISGDQGTTPR